jgi:hypothetical protein
MKNKKIIIIGAIVVLALFAFSKDENNTDTPTTDDLDPSTMSNFLGQSNYVRGIRNNNPLNIKKSTRNYYGKVPLSRNTDGMHEQFEAFPFGIGAAIIHIRSRYLTGAIGIIPDCVGVKHYPPHDTIQKIANIWAPKGCDPSPTLPNGNNPDEYANFVARDTGFDKNMKIDGNDYETMSALLKAMCLFENGTRYRSSIFGTWDTDFKIAWTVANL